jgi:hypothetical protein
LLDDVKHLVEAGFAVHWLRERSKAPFTNAWASEPVYSFDALKRAYRPGYNVGVRLGEPSRIGKLYLQVLDLDVRKPEMIEQAKARLRDFLPEYADVPTVISGSGGDSRHFYFLTTEPFRSKKVAHSVEFFHDTEGKKHWVWEIELFGTGKQVVLPPSIHPVTGNPYLWAREFDFDLVEMGLGPVVSADRVKSWHATLAMEDSKGQDDNDLTAHLHKQPMDLTLDEIDATLAALPLGEWCEDREGWTTVGMALHHQFEGGDGGLRLWRAFSKQSAKFDEKDLVRVWKSFRITGKSMRFAMLLKAAADARLRDELSGVGLFENIETDDDLLGELPGDDDDVLGTVAVVEPAKPSLGWVSKIDRNEEGAIKPTLHNVKLIVCNDPRLKTVVAFNEFTGESVQRGMPGKKIARKESPKGTVQLEGPIWVLKDKVNGDLWTDDKDNAVRAMMEAPTRQGGYGIKISDRDLHAAIDIISRDNAFHPVREYLSGLTWDGVPRLDSLFIRFLGADDTPYTRAVARMTLVGGVARVMKPGHKFDFATILEGLQGKRKSTFIRILAKDWFSELDGDFHDPKQMVESMQGSWILEIPELSGFGRADVRQIKAFISRQSDKVRLSYARRAQQYDRQCIMLGSTNDQEYLRDDTGGRRFWPIRCEVDEIDTAGFAVEVDQVWAEAKAAYDVMRAKHGEYGDLPLYLTGEDASGEAVRIQEDRRVESAEDGLAGKIEAWLDRPIVDETGLADLDDVLGDLPVLRQETCLLEVWETCLGRDAAGYGQIQSQQLGRAMKKIKGWYSDGFMRFEKYGKQRVSRRTGSLCLK